MRTAQDITWDTVQARRGELLLDPEESSLLYLQLEASLKQKIVTGEYEVGERIPTELEMCKEYGVSRITVRRAVQDLVEEGMLKKLRGRGTFVAVPKHVLGMQRATERGWSAFEGESNPTHKEVLEKVTLSANETLAEKLGIEVGAEAYLIRRLIHEEEFPMAIDELFVSAEMFPGLLDLMNDSASFYDLAEHRYGLSFGLEDLTLSVSSARGDESRVLKCPPAAPLFILRKVMWTSDGRPMHYSKTILRGDRVSYHFRVDRDGKVRNDGREFTLS